MLTNTKTLFAGLVKEAQADCICDVGSRDGMQALLFRYLRPEAKVLAFEANPILFREMSNDPRLKEERVEVYPYAISDREGTIDFFVIDIDYNDPEENRGTSSLFKRSNDKVKEAVKVRRCESTHFSPNTRPKPIESVSGSTPKALNISSRRASLV